jgi:tRNA threonylcarbamoyl adenosine modification protein YeaZ
VELSISTATAACSVALLDGDRIVAERHEVVGRGHAEHLIPMIQSLPDSGRADRIWVDCGPGSFTGTRVGLAAARALAIAWEVPVAGFSSLPLIATHVLGDGEDVAVALLGGHGELFVQEFSLAPFSPLGIVQSLRPEAAASLMKADRVLGSGAAALVEVRGYGSAHEILPRAADARALSDTMRQLPPRAIYVRAPDAKAA